MRCWFLVALFVFGGFTTELVAQEKPATAVLANTERLTIERPLHEVMVEGIDKFALRALTESTKNRERHWKRDYSSVENYLKSIEPNRQRFQTIIGAVDARTDRPRIIIEKPLPRPLEVRPEPSRTPSFNIETVSWPVMEGVTGEGLLLVPKFPNEPKGYVIAIPDADMTPEVFCGFDGKLDPQARLPRRLVEQGFIVLVPTLINRADTYSGHPDIRYTNQPHREFIYRMAFQMGRHIIGYEVQKMRAAIDAFESQNKSTNQNLPIGVVGMGEGGLLAMYTAAVDERVQSTLVCGYFEQREGVWQEPIYRNIWNLLGEFGDAEIASLIAPRNLVIEACSAPEIDGPPKPKQGRSGGAAPGRIRTPPVSSVKQEYDRAWTHFKNLNHGHHLHLTIPKETNAHAGSADALMHFQIPLGVETPIKSPITIDMFHKSGSEVSTRQKRQVEELVRFTQRLLHSSDKVRRKFWSKTDRSSVGQWVKTSQFYRDYVWDEMIGRLLDPVKEMKPRSRKILETDQYAGYEVVLDVFPDVIATGILLIPKDLNLNERRPVVVCQHGLEGTPMSTIATDPRSFGPYKSFSVKLVERGFIVYAPQNPYIGRDKFRTLQRKSNPVKRSLFSYILAQHTQTLRWLKSLPMVDPDRVAFYGLSYGGKTAVRVPPLLKDGYCLSICSADFNEWIRKNVSHEDRYSYIFTGEYEMFEWNMGHVADYAELSTLMTPRPFMVERGHNDGVAPDEWVAWEYAKVRRHYNQLGLGDKTEIEFFDGPHTINGQGTFEFLHKHLNWPKPAE